MKTSELVRHVAKDLLDDRKELISGEEDHLFSDSLICTFLTDAQRILSRRAWVLEDSGASCATKVQLVENKAEYLLDKSVLFVKSAKLSDSDVPLVRAKYTDTTLAPASTQQPVWDVNVVQRTSPGRPTHFSTDKGIRVLRLWRQPDQDSAGLMVHLNAVRMPLAAISMSEPDAEPEVPEEFHLLLTKYAAGMCLQRPKVESELRALGRTMVTEFNAAVDEAKRDRQRLQLGEPRHVFNSSTAGS